MRRITIPFENETLDLEVDDARLVGAWSGPPGLPPDEARHAVHEALNAPHGYPPLGRMVVEGDRVVIASNLERSLADLVLPEVVARLKAAGVASLTIVSPRDLPAVAWEGVDHVKHDPADRDRLAYLATTQAGERVYLDRTMVDADCTIVVGQLGPDDSGRIAGPWTLVYPGLTDFEGIKRERAKPPKPAATNPDDAEDDEEARDAPGEVSWLLGNPFQVAVLPGATGLHRLIAGEGKSVREWSEAELAVAWSPRFAEAADLVIAGIGAPGRQTTWEDLAAGLLSATRLVQRGGRIVILSRLSAEIGPALHAVLNAQDRRAASSALRGLEAEVDWPIARRIVDTLAWADVFLLSKLDSAIVDDLGMCPVESPRDAARLTKEATSIIAIGQADRAFPKLDDAEEDDNGSDTSP